MKHTYKLVIGLLLAKSFTSAIQLAQDEDGDKAAEEAADKQVAEGITEAVDEASDSED